MCEPACRTGGCQFRWQWDELGWQRPGLEIAAKLVMHVPRFTGDFTGIGKHP